MLVNCFLTEELDDYMEVSIDGGTQKWLVFVRENPTKMDDLGVPPFMETPICG